MRLALVILNFNTRNFLEEYLPKVIEFSPQAEIYVIDNGSWDDSVEYLNKNFPEISLVKLTKNLGFAGGYQEGLKSINSDWYLLLNSDVLPSKNWLEPLINYVKDKPIVKVVQPYLYTIENESKFEYAGAAGGFWDYLGYPFCRGRVFQNLEMDEGQYPSGKIGWATGAALMIDSKVYWESGGLDTYFFAHMEEIDLCWRVQRMGYEIHAVSESKVQHVGGGTLQVGSPMKTYLNFRNNLILLFKNLPLLHFLPVLMARLILDGVAGLKFLLEGNPKHCLAIIHAHFGFYSYALFQKKEKYTFKKRGKITFFKGFILLKYFGGRKIKL